MSEGTTNSNGDNKLNNRVEYVDNEEIQKHWDKESIKFCCSMYLVKDTKERSDKASETSTELGTGVVEVDLQEIRNLTYAEVRPAIFSDPIKQTSLKGKGKDEKKKSEISEKTGKELDESEK